MSYGDRDPGASPTAGAPLLGPAISPRAAAAPALRSLDGPLPPFVGARALSRTEPVEPPEPEEPAEPVETPTPIEVVEAPAPIEEQEMPPRVDPLEEAPGGIVSAPAEAEEVARFWGDEVAEPWAELPVAAEPEAVAPSIEQEEIVMEELTWLDFDVADDVALVGAPVDATPGASEPLASDSLIGDELLAPPAWEYGLDTTAEPAPAPEGTRAAEPDHEPAPTAPAPKSPALEDVAARLEHIAKSLRERNPAELLATADDPLQLLIAGYAMGLAARPAAQPDRAGETPG